MHIKLITRLMVQLTNQCTMMCPYCFAPKSAQRMSKETLYDIVQFLIKNAETENVVPYLIFFGGEPLLEWELITYITDYIRNEYGKPFNLSMTTNGTLLTAKKLDYMYEHNIRALYSIDGGYETMNINRPMCSGESSFDVVSKNLKRVLIYYPEAKARLTLYRPTAGNFFSDMMAIEDIGFERFSVVPNYFDDWSEEDVQIVKEQVSKYGGYLIDRFRTGQPYIIYEEFCECFHRVVSQNEHIRTGKQRECAGCNKCGFGLSGFATTDYLGNIYGCLHVDTLDKDSVFYLGDIHNGIDTERSISLVKSYDDSNILGIDCENCTLSRICDKGCASNNYLYGKDFGKVPPMFCHYSRILMDEAIRTCNILGNEKNEDFKKLFVHFVKGGDKHH